MFERFTDRARRIVVLSQEEARALDHGHIGTEHILLGLLREDDVASEVLTSVGITHESVKQEVLRIMGRGKHAPAGHIPFTARAKKVLELSLRESLQLGHNYIAGAHILLGIIREGEGVGVQALTNLGADLSKMRQEVVMAASQTREWAPSAAGVSGLEPAAPPAGPGSGEIAGQLTSIAGQLTSISDRLTSVTGQLTSVEGRLTSIEGRLTAVEARFAAVEHRFSAGPSRAGEAKDTSESDTDELFNTDDASGTGKSADTGDSSGIEEASRAEDAAGANESPGIGESFDAGQSPGTGELPDTG